MLCTPTSQLSKLRLLFVLGVAALSCNKSTPSSTATIGPSGGILAINDVVVVFPPGALPQEQTLTLAVREGPVAQISPDIFLAKPATVTFGSTWSVPSGSIARHLNPADGEWYMIGGVEVSPDGAASFDAIEFSDVGPALPKLKLPSDCLNPWLPSEVCESIAETTAQPEIERTEVGEHDGCLVNASDIVGSRHDPVSQRVPLLLRSHSEATAMTREARDALAIASALVRGELVDADGSRPFDIWLNGAFDSTGTFHGPIRPGQIGSHHYYGEALDLTLSRNGTKIWDPALVGLLPPVLLRAGFTWVWYEPPGPKDPNGRAHVHASISSPSLSGCTGVADGGIQDAGIADAGGSSSSSSGGRGTAPHWANWPVPPDAPTAYQLNANTALDMVTGLTWQRASPAGPYFWDQAGAYCETLELDGVTTWRLPSYIELISIIDFSVMNGGAWLREGVFGPVQSGAFFWSSTIADGIIFEAGGSGELAARAVGFDGAMGEFVAPLANPTGFRCTGFSPCLPVTVRCVSGEPAPPMGERFELDAGVGLVHDRATGLSWHRVSGQALDQAAADQYCAPPWRMPTAKELATIIDGAASRPALDTRVFPDIINPAYPFFYTSTPLSASSNGIYVVNFDDGTMRGAGPGTYHVRCVSGPNGG